MSAWWAKSLGDGLWAPIAAAEIQTLFEPVFASVGKPGEMAVFTRSEEGRLHCEVIAYFSPAAGRVAEACGADPCGKPLRQGLELLAGQENCWEMLFPRGGAQVAGRLREN